MIGILSPLVNHPPASTSTATIPIIMNSHFDAPASGQEYGSPMGGRDRFAPPIVGGNDTYAPIDFTAEDMSFWIDTNAEASSDQTIEFMVQQIDTSLIITVGSTQTGLFQDLVNTHDVKGRQKIQYHFDPLTANPRMTIAGSGLKTSNVMMHGMGGQNNAVGSASVIFYAGISGSDSSATEADVECVIDTADTCHLLTIFISTNPNTTGIFYVRTRIGGSDGTLTLGIGIGQTGRFTQFNGEQALAAEDIFTIECDNTDGDNSLNVSYPTWVSKDGISQVGGSVRQDVTGSSQEYQSWVDGVAIWTTTVRRRVTVTPMALTIDAITAYVPTNNSGSNSIVATRIEDVDEANPIITYSTGQTGVFRATTDSGAVASGDRVQMREDAGDTSVIVQAWCVLMK